VNLLSPGFAVDFTKFLDRVEDVVAFSKIVPKIGFFVEYRDSNGGLRLYYPDFVLLTDKKESLVIETKGRVDVNVKYKDRRIRLWCEDVTKLMKGKWVFIRLDQEDFKKYRFKSVKELVSTLGG
jgi:type III restriction enzyme